MSMRATLVIFSTEAEIAKNNNAVKYSILLQSY